LPAEAKAITKCREIEEVALAIGVVVVTEVTGAVVVAIEEVAAEQAGEEEDKFENNF
jgi:uncharacterized membrane protein